MSTWVKAAIALVLFGAGFGAGTYVRSQSARADVNEVKLDRAADQTGLALASAQAEAAQRAHEQNQAAGIHSAAESYQKGKADAESASKRTVDDLVAGNRRLRDQWATCQVTTAAAVSASAGGQRPDGGDRLRADGVGRILRAVGQCQAQRDALQQALINERAATEDHR
ncbi:hypothetical protein ACQKIE_01095 [Luteibacter sp. NPDC031894]|uniref:hypothetical protein n=1 Tax=Luteibacter sp. NPDC031894 TaxID=3390572 RepID=UPI003D07C72D